MATAASTLIQRTRRLLRDYPELDVSTASLASNGTSLSVAATATDRYAVNNLLQLGQEVVQVTAVAATSLTIRRALRGTTAAAISSGQSILVQPAFFDIEILDALNEGLDATFPKLYRPVSKEYTGPNGTTYEWNLPNMSGILVPIPYLSNIEIKESGDLTFRRERAWNVVRSEAPFVKFRRAPTSGSTIRLTGYGPFTHLTAITDTLDSFFPVQAEYLPTLYAASVMLASGEAGRVRVDVGTIDQREQANRVGSSSAASDSLLRRFYQRLQDSAMPPMPPHVVSLI